MAAPTPYSARHAHLDASSAPFVARQHELQRMLSVVEVVTLGRSQLVLLQGEAGIGKTRLAREVLARAGMTGIPGYLGRCFDEYTAVPFFPFSEMIAAILVGSPPELRTRAPERWPELAHIVPELGTRRDADSQETQLQVFRAATAFVHAVADENPLVLILDDMHWADSTSLALLLYLARHLHDARVLILGTYRGSEVARRPALESTLRELVRERLAEEVDLAPLPVTGTAALIQSRLPESVSNQLVALVHGRAQGNPFFTEELLAAFLDKGVISPGADDVRSDVLDEFILPRSIQSVVGERVGRLPPDAQELLSLASVLGQEFDLDVLAATSGRSEAAVLTALDTALDALLIEERHAALGDRYGFAHALIQEALYERLHKHHRRRLHFRTAEVLERLRGVQPTAAAAVAKHFLQGGDRDRAKVYVMQAGDEAAGRHAHAEAAKHYGIALELLHETGDAVGAAQVQRRLAGELHDLNRLPEAAEAYTAALAGFERLGDRHGQAMAQWGLGRLADSRYDMLAAIRHLDAALRLWPEEREDAGLARLLADAARAKTFRGDPAAAIALAERGLAVAERLEDAGLLARALLGVATAHDQDTLDLQLIQLLDRAEGLARAAGDWHTLSRIFSSRAVKRFHIGALFGALEDRRSSIDAAERSAAAPRLVFAYEALANDCMFIGAWVEGREAARAGLALQREGLSSPYLVHLDLAWMEGRYEEAVTVVQSMVSDARARGDMQGVTDGLATLADFGIQLGRPAQSESPAREAVEVARSSWRSELSGCAVILAETLARLGVPGIESVLREGQRLIDQQGKRAFLPQLLRARGLWLLQRGNINGAIAELEASAALARSQHASIELGRTLAALADAAKECGDKELAARTTAERAALVDQIGPEVRGLAWARGLPGARRRRAERAPSDDRAPAGLLTPRERQVAALIAQGLTDRQIADRLVITEGTAGIHVGHILNKLGFHVRAEVAMWAVRHGLGDAPEA